MTFEEQIIITLIDNGMLAAIAGFDGFTINWILQRKKSRDETLHELTPSRVDAFRKVWAITGTGKFITSEKQDIPIEKRLEIDRKLIDWYYDGSGALFLSWSTTKHFLRAVA